MLKKIVVLLFIVFFLFQPMHEAFAIEIEWAHVFRDNRVFETGAFIGVTDRDGMGASAAVYVDIGDPDDYEVYLTSSSPGPVDIYLTKYRDLGGGSWEYVNPTPLAPPSTAWENVTYTFTLVYASDKSPVGVPVKTWYICSDDVTDPDPVPTPDPSSVVLSGTCSSLHIEWENVLGNVLQYGPFTGHYAIRVYLVDPDGRLNYAIYSYQYGKWPKPEFDFPDSLCGDFCQSWAIGIQSRINHCGVNPLGGGLVNRSQYYFKYDPDPSCTNVYIDINPGSDPNSINCNNEKEIIAVAILTTDDFDATTVDHTTVTFQGASETHVNKKTGEPRKHEEDVDGDGDTDLVFHFHNGDTNLTCESTEGILTGETSDGQAIGGRDAVRMTD
jgi:hypothetical protein